MSRYTKLGEVRQKWADAFNALPDEVRRIGAAEEAMVRLQELHFRREELCKAYDRALREIGEREKLIVSHINQLGEP